MEALRSIRERLKDPDRFVRAAAVHVLVRDPASSEIVRAGLDEDDPLRDLDRPAGRRHAQMTTRKRAAAAIVPPLRAGGWTADAEQWSDTSVEVSHPPKIAASGQRGEETLPGPGQAGGGDDHGAHRTDWRGTREADLHRAP